MCIKMVDSSLLADKTIYYALLNRISWTEELLSKSHINLRVNICVYLLVKTYIQNPRNFIFFNDNVTFSFSIFFILVPFAVLKKISFFSHISILFSIYLHCKSLMHLLFSAT